MSLFQPWICLQWRPLRQRRAPWRYPGELGPTAVMVEAARAAAKTEEVLRMVGVTAEAEAEGGRPAWFGCISYSLEAAVQAVRWQLRHCRPPRPHSASSRQDPMGPRRKNEDYHETFSSCYVTLPVWRRCCGDDDDGGGGATTDCCACDAVRCTSGSPQTVARRKMRGLRSTAASARHPRKDTCGERPTSPVRGAYHCPWCLR